MQRRPGERSVSYGKKHIEMPRTTYPIAYSCCTVLARFQRMNEGNNDTRARVADSVAESDGATIRSQNVIM